MSPVESKLVRLQHFLTPARTSLRGLRVGRPATPDQILHFESIIGSLFQQSGVYRTTFRHRFRNLDPLVSEILLRLFPANSPLKVADWAASDCLTSMEWASELCGLFPNAEFSASDLALSLYEIHTRPDEIFIAQEDGAVLQAISGSRILQLHPMESSRRPWRRWPALRALRRFESIWSAIPPSARELDSWSSPTGVHFSRLSLIHPEAREFALENPHFTISRHSVFQPLAKPVHVIRTMNIFNNCYFSPEKLKTGIEAVQKSLLPNGVWILGRTFDSEAGHHAATIFQLQQDGFCRLDRMGPGSEIEPLVPMSATELCR